MAATRKRKYEKIDDAEIDLVLQCRDSHEFYEHYREIFPDRKKGIDSISKIWKRRAEFQKKRKPATASDDGSTVITLETIELLLRSQNEILTEMNTLLREQVAMKREVTTLQRQYLSEAARRRYENHTGECHKEVKHPETKESAKRAIIEKAGNIMIGS